LRAVEVAYLRDDEKAVIGVERGRPRVSHRTYIPLRSLYLPETDACDTDNGVSPIEGARTHYGIERYSDTGIGMTKEVRQRAVDPFFTTKPLGKGTGLGLSMTFGYVQQSGGHLDIQSDPGKGTTITILLPPFVPQSVPVGA